MRLLFDALTVGSPGILQLRDELIGALLVSAPADAEVTLLTAAGFTPLRGSSQLKTVTLQKPPLGWAGRWWWYHLGLPAAARKHQADAVYSLSGILSRPLSRAAATVVTVNNMMPFTPERWTLYARHSRARLRYRMLRGRYVASLRAADAVVLHSRHALETVTPYTGDISSKTRVALTGVPSDLGFDVARPPAHPYGGRPYWLYFSAVYAYKNHLPWIDAYRRALSEAPDLPDLLVAGIPADRKHLTSIEAALQDPALKGRARYLGVLDRAAIPAWLHHAEVNWFPSTCETNSVALAEILGVGGVLACSEIAPMSEVAGGAARSFDPFSIPDMARAMVELQREEKLRAELRHRALARAAELSWRECGEAIWASVESAVESFRQRRAG